MARHHWPKISKKVLSMLSPLPTKWHFYYRLRPCRFLHYSRQFFSDPFSHAALFCKMLYHTNNVYHCTTLPRNRPKQTHHIGWNQVAMKLIQPSVSDLVRRTRCRPVYYRLLTIFRGKSLRASCRRAGFHFSWVITGRSLCVGKFMLIPVHRSEMCYESVRM